MKIHQACKEYLHHCKHNKQLSHHSISAYKRDLTCFIQAVHITFLKDCNKEVLKQYLTHLNYSNLSKRTIKRRVACLKSMFRWLEMEEQIEYNPFHKLEIKIKLPLQLPRNISKINVSRVYQTALSELNITHGICSDKLNEIIKKPRDVNKLSTLVCIELLFCTGIRVGELSKITLDDVCLAEKRIKINGKGQRERYVFLPDLQICKLLDIYLTYRKITQPKFSNLIVNSRGNPASTQFIRKLIHNITKLAKINSKITPHMYRHTNACTLLEEGLDIRYVQKLLGHQNISTTELYTHVNNQILQQKISAINIRRRL